MGLSTMVVSIPASSVRPSGADFATICAPIAVLAPARFSITTGWPQRSLMRWPTKRAMRSVGPPGGNGTMIRMGRFGKFVAVSGSDCAAAGKSKAANAIAARANRNMSRPLVELHPDRLDHLLAGFGLRLDEGAEVFRTLADAGLDSGIEQALLDVRHRQHFGERRIYSRDDL